VVVRGLEGEVVVNGVKYNSVMPAMTQLSDQEIAERTHVRDELVGNAGGAVNVSQVAAVRAKAAKEPKTASSPTQHRRPRPSSSTPERHRRRARQA